MSEENIVKRVCKELNLTQRELAEIIKVNSGTPAQWVTKGEVPPTYQYLLELMIENKHLKEKIAKLATFKELLNEIQSNGNSVALYPNKLFIKKYYLQ